MSGLLPESYARKRRELKVLVMKDVPGLGHLLDTAMTEAVRAGLADDAEWRLFRRCCRALC
jgi:hypothetical protein